MSEGFVYVMSNPAMPGLVKVGMTERLPHVRAEEIGNHESLPLRMVVEYYALVQGSAGEIERSVHKHLSPMRAGKEWFRCEPELAIAAIQQLAGNRKQFEKYVNVDQLRTKAERDFLEAERLATEQKKRADLAEQEQRNAHIKAIDAAYRQIGNEFLKLEPIAKKAFERHESVARAVVDEFTFRDYRQLSKDDKDRVPRGIRPVEQWPLEDILLLTRFNQLDYYLRKGGGRPKKHNTPIARGLLGDYFSVPEFVIREFSRRRDIAQSKAQFNDCLYPQYAKLFK